MSASAQTGPASPNRRGERQPSQPRLNLAIAPRLRGDLLKALGLSEEQLAGLAPRRRGAIEQALNARVLDFVGREGLKPGLLVDLIV